MSNHTPQRDGNPNTAAVESGQPHTNLSGLPIKTSYSDRDIADFDSTRDLGSPGEYPFVRGVHQKMYRQKLWTIRQLGSLDSPAKANERIRQLIDMGATGVSICLDLPTIMGRDSDDPLAEGEVGSCGGVAIDTLEDMRDLLSGIALEKISINFVSNSQSAVILAMFAAVTEEQEIAWDQLTGTMQNDILKEYQAQKSYYFPPRPSMRLTMDTIQFCNRYMPRFNPISISGYHLASAGATPVQELAFTLSNGFTYVEEGIKAGLPVDSFAPRLSFFFKAHNDFFENIAKLRAARRIWARTLRESYGAKNPRSWRLRVHIQTSGSSLTAQQAENNVIRVTLQALSAVLAGTQSLHTNAFDEAFSVPTPRSEKLALRTQQIIAHESGVANTADPLAGSYYLESLTNEMEKECRRIFKEIEGLGGVLSAIEKGYYQRAIADAAFRYQRDIETKHRVVVGLNAFVEDEDIEMQLREPEADFERKKVTGLKKLKNNRDNEQVQEILKEIKAVAGGTDSMMPTLIKAVKSYATLGEIIGVMREVFGEYREDAIY
ncbi:MAG: methylmalonyl-CoA mutase family protein [Desulfobacteraceae bacterium]|jgi:methylmalonyl-CoA mutase N-terminal domain/subunit